MRLPQVEPMPRHSGLRKAAIFVLVMGDSLASEIFTRLTEDEIRRLGQTAATLENVTREEVVEVLSEFKQNFQGGQVPRQGAGTAFQLMVEQALGEERALDLLRDDHGEDPFHACRLADPETLASLLEAEHPQTRAIVLSRLAPAQASAIMSHWSPELSADAVYRIAHLGRISDDVERDVGLTLSSLLESVQVDPAGEAPDIESLTVEVVKGLPGDQGEVLFQHLETYDQDFARRLKEKLFTFDDLAGLDSRSMQRLLREVDTQSLAVAMKGASEELADLIYASMSSRAAEMLRDDLAAMGPRRLQEVEAAQTAIMTVALQLEEDGAITIPRGSDELL